MPPPPFKHVINGFTGSWLYLIMETYHDGGFVVPTWHPSIPLSRNLWTTECSGFLSPPLLRIVMADGEKQGSEQPPTEQFKCYMLHSLSECFVVCHLFRGTEIKLGELNSLNTCTKHFNQFFFFWIIFKPALQFSSSISPLSLFRTITRMSSGNKTVICHIITKESITCNFTGGHNSF